MLHWQRREKNTVVGARGKTVVSLGTGGRRSTCGRHQGENGRAQPTVAKSVTLRGEAANEGVSRKNQERNKKSFKKNSIREDTEKTGHLKDNKRGGGGAQSAGGC